MPKPTNQIQYRQVSFTRDAVNEEERTVDLAFSSETEKVERMFGIEILDHSKGSVRMERLKDSAPLLLSHDDRDLVGVIERASIDKDKTGRATVRFSRSAKAEEVFQDVKDGIRKHVSVGYRVHAMELERSEDNKPDVFRITDWEPLEISLVSVPADISVGVGRIDPILDKGDSSMPKEKDEQTPKEPAVDVRQIQDEARRNELERIREIDALGERLGHDEGRSLAKQYITEGNTIDEFRAAAMDKFMGKPPQPVAPAANLGMSDNDIKRFSVVSAIRAVMLQDWGLAEFEKECSDQVGKQLKREASSFFVPNDILTRDLNVGTATAGGHTVSTNLLTESFIDILRGKLMVRALGATILGGLQGNIDIPGLTSGSATFWVGEGAAPTQSDPVFRQVPMAPKTVGALTKLTRKLILQSSMDIEAFVRALLATELAQEIDRVAINGSGVGSQPTGILQTAGIGAVVGGTNGLAPTWGHIIDLESDVSVANADVGSLGYLTTPQARGKLKQTEKFAGSNGMPVWPDGRSADGFGTLNGYRAGATTQVPSNLVKGSSGATLSAIIFGNWADLVIGEWGVLDLQVNPFIEGNEGNVVIRSLQDVDIAVKRAASFSAMVDAITV